MPVVFAMEITQHALDAGPKHHRFLQEAMMCQMA
jgi:hypothetical protein